MTLGEILSGAPLVGTIPPALAAARVSGVAYDSRKVAPGFLFFAFPGKHVDGGAFAARAFEGGALAVVSESPRPADAAGEWIQVGHGRQALAVAARNFFGKPDERIAITGISGTNGKTTTAFLLDAILRGAGHTTALAGTIEYRLAGRVTTAVNTTPESLELFRMFSELSAAGG
ncbi:MAG TPA: Mur ligase domain-containing protein, partial [Bryobacteraceae bacterium]|nr:Mur ligase domain-containing protein [Bryobacteraceae bacterium]